LKKLQSSEEEIDVQDSLHKIVTSEDDVDDYNSIVPELKLSIFEHLDEFQIEIESRYKGKRFLYSMRSTGKCILPTIVICFRV